MEPPAGEPLVNRLISWSILNPSALRSSDLPPSVYNQLHENINTPDSNQGSLNNPDRTASRRLKLNFIFFSLFYSIIHAAVDCVIAFSSAELGTTLGSYGGFTLYIAYTLSSLLLAKPVLYSFPSSKFVVLLGLLGMLFYVICFYFAILWISLKYYFFLFGAGVGGLGAGLLWTSQGVYYTLNAKLYSYYKNENKNEIIYRFAAIFAVFYLLIECVLQFLSTFIYYLFDSFHGDEEVGKKTVFGIYTGLAFLCLVCYWIVILDFKDEELKEREANSIKNTHSGEELVDDQEESIYFGTSSSHPLSSEQEKTMNNSRIMKSTNSRNVTTSNNSVTSALPSSKSRNPNNSTSNNNNNNNHNHNNVQQPTETQIMLTHVFSVAKALLTNRKLQLLMPFQVAFGLSTGLIQIYVNGVIVKDYLGGSYIGLFAGIITLTAVVIAQPLAWISRHYETNGTGIRVIMFFGGFSFSLGGLLLLVLSREMIAKWEIIIFYYIFHGIGRGIWENTNKAIIAEYFSSSSTEERDVSFASIYFASGFSGAMGFLFFQFISVRNIAILNTIVSFLGMVGFLLAQNIHEREKKSELITDIHQLVVEDEEEEEFDFNSSLQTLT
jgi:MFS family permease